MQLLCASVAVTTTLLERQIHGTRRPIWSHGGWRNKARGEGTTRRGRFIGVEALDCTPLPHNEMLARTYSASNFGSITPLANQMTALAASWRCACLSISRHSPASTSVPHMTQLVPRLRRGLSARTLTARAMACEPLNSVGTRASHLEVVKRYLRSLRTRPSDNDRTQRARCA